MSTANDKLLQYLNEAQATEQALVSTLRAHIAMTPRGSYRDDLEEHLRTTRRHAQLVRERIGRLGTSFNPLALGIGLAETIAGQVMALGKMPVDILRGMSVEEKLLKNAKDECATEALEIATYMALESLAIDAGDLETAEVAARIRQDEEAFLQRLLEHIPQLSTMVAAAEIRGRHTVNVRTVGAADKARSTVRRARRTTRRATTRATTTATRTTKSTARTARKATRRAVAATSAPARREPWSGYDEQPAAEIADKVQQLPASRKERVREYEEQHKDRSTVVEAAQTS
ncbi:MAG TPA: ferritin-like domain-containing protein [Candidatus Dormibacteraeota bacterium]